MEDNNKINKKINKNLAFGILIAAGVILLGVIAWFAFQAKAPVTTEIEKIEKEETLSEILQRLTAKDAKPLTDKEREELDQLLRQLTPQRTSQMTPEQQQELEDSLKQLTP